MAKDYAKLLERATPYHTQVVEAYKAKVSSDGFSCYRNQPNPQKVFDALYKSGGGLTPDELFSASGVEDREQFDMIVSRMENGTSAEQFVFALNNARRRAFNYRLDMLDVGKLNSILPDALACLQISGVDSCMAESDGRLYLWCQQDSDGNYKRDVLAAYEDSFETVKTCESEIAAAQGAPEQIEILQDEAKSLEAQISALGLFKGKQKKPLKERLAVVNDDISKLKTKVEIANKAENTLEGVRKALDDFEQS